MEIYVKNVKFGDCSLIYEDKDFLLIDCGSCNAGGVPKMKRGKFAYSQIASDIINNNNKMRNLMISHFDSDHFNGILEIPNTYRFDNTYLPYSIIDGHTIFSETIGLLLAIAPNRSWGFQLSRQIVDLFIKLSKISKKITFVKRGDIINLGKEKINILWPEIEKIYPNMISINDNLDIPVSLEWSNLIDSFSNAFDLYIVNLHLENAYSSREYIIGFEQAYENLLSAHNNFINGSNYLNNKDSIQKFCYAKYHKLIKSINATSIICDCKEHFISLGDAPKEVIEYLKDDYNSIYNVVKIQHHATKKYYTKSTPNGKIYILSNGGYKNRKIDNRFLLTNGEFICTQKSSANINCEYYCCTKTCYKSCKSINFCPIYC